MGFQVVGRNSRNPASPRVGAEALDRLRLLQQRDRRDGIAGIADGQTHNLGRTSPGHAEIEEVLIFDHQDQALLSGAHGWSSETAPSAAATTVLKGFRPAGSCGALTLACLHHRCAGDQPLFALRRKSETGQHIFMGELGEVQPQFSFQPAGCQGAEHIADRQPCTPHARLAVAAGRAER